MAACPVSARSVRRFNCRGKIHAAKYLAAFDMLATCDREPLRSHRPSVRLPILNLTRAILLAVVAGILVVVTSEPEETVQESPVWSGATGHPQGIWAVAFTSDGRRLATGGVDGDVVIWEVGKGL